MKIVDAFTLSAEHRELLRPGEMVAVGEAEYHTLPRFFYEIDSWEHAKATQLTAHFTLAELITVDCHEADLLLRTFPHYVPCAVAVLARYLEEFRQRVDAPVCVAVNGGYRSPAHRPHISSAASHVRSELEEEHGNRPRRFSPHQWATAANLYRIGDTWLDSQKSIERFARIAESIGGEVFVRPYGPAPGETDDHLHLDLGYLLCAPGGYTEAR
jgi:hypothetical protein